MANNDREFHRQKIEALQMGYTPVRIGAVAFYFAMFGLAVIVLARI